MNHIQDPEQKLLIVGLTGGIGSGKSTVAKMFEDHGAGVIDTDAIAHQLTQADGEAIATIRAAFGNDYISRDGALDRSKMRGHIFSDIGAKHRLEKILHPMILSHAKAALQKMHGKPYIIIVVPLLPEKPSFRQLVHRVLVVDCSEAAQIERVMGRNHISEQEVRNIIAQQTPRDERLKIADDVIQNDNNMYHLVSQICVLHERYSHNN